MTFRPTRDQAYKLLVANAECWGSCQCVERLHDALVKAYEAGCADLAASQELNSLNGQALTELEANLAACQEQVKEWKAKLAACENELCTAKDQIPSDMDGESLSVALIKLKDKLAACERERDELKYQAQVIADTVGEENWSIRRELTVARSRAERLEQALKDVLPLARAYQVYSFNTKDHRTVIEHAQDALKESQG